MSIAFSRRTFLQVSALAGGAVLLRQGAGIHEARAASPGPNLLLFAYFSGGWDQLLALDPRSNTDPRFQQGAAYGPTGSGIYPAYHLVTDPEVRTLLGTNPSGVQAGAGSLTFGPSIPRSLLDQSGELTVVRGISMDTLTHEVGRRYFLTGKFPRGLAANGSALPAVVAASQSGGVAMPNLAVSTESYAEGLPTYAGPVRVGSAGDIVRALAPLGTVMDAEGAKALDAFGQIETCEHKAHDGDGLVRTYKESRTKALSLGAANVARLFQFNATNPSPDVAPLFAALGITTAADLAGPKGKAAIAAQALHRGVAHAVSLELARDLDDHFDWDTDHSQKLRLSFDTLGRLIAYLKTVQYPGTTESVWSFTTLVVFSEFARTPLLNLDRGGRDHHLANSALVAGPGLKKGVVVGGTTDLHMGASNVDPATGAKVASGGMRLRPADLHATVLQSMGLPYTNLSNQSPQVIPALLKA
jgi:uncharacterized protein (DUF1501 family)